MKWLRELPARLRVEAQELQDVYPELKDFNPEVALAPGSRMRDMLLAGVPLRHVYEMANLERAMQVMRGLRDEVKAEIKAELLAKLDTVVLKFEGQEPITLEVERFHHSRWRKSTGDKPA